MTALLREKGHATHPVTQLLTAPQHIFLTPNTQTRKTRVLKPSSVFHMMSEQAEAVAPLGAPPRGSDADVVLAHASRRPRPLPQLVDILGKLAPLHALVLVRPRRRPSVDSNCCLSQATS